MRRALESWIDRLVALDDLDPRARVVVGCSGGADSLALLALACATGLDAVAVYVDHGLRDAGVHEAAIVAGAAEAYGAAARVERVTVAAGGNLEARARDERYAALERARADVDAVATLVGHTADDQAETVLLNLLRGSGLAGLAGAASRHGTVRRPLLALRRSETREICARLRLAPVNDPMNDELRFRRVWLRREVIPRLEKGASRDLVEVLARQADVLRDDDDLLDELAAATDPTDARALVELSRPLARRVVRRWLGAPPASLATVDAVLDVARGNRRAVELPARGRVERSSGRLQLVPRVAPEPPAAVPLAVPGHAAFGGAEVSTWIELGAPAFWPDGRLVAVCDAERAGTTGIVVRPPIAGERFRPVGQGGSKLVRDALAEAGVSSASRAAAPVVAGRDVIWVVGYRIDDRVRVTEDTREYLWMSAEPRSAESPA